MDTSKPVGRSAKAPASRSTRQSTQDSARRPPRHVGPETSRVSTAQSIRQPSKQSTTSPSRLALGSKSAGPTQQATRAPTKESVRLTTRDPPSISVPRPPTMRQLNNTPLVQPVTMEEATLYITTRIPPVHAIEPVRQYIFPTIASRRISNPSLHLPQHFSFRPSQNTQRLSIPAVQPFYNPAFGSKVPSQPRPLPEAKPPPLYTERQLQSIPIEHVNRMKLQRMYSMIYHHLERNGGWIWWEMPWLDIKKMEAELFENEEVPVDEDTAQGEILGEEEEEIPEHERIRSEKHKRIAALVARHFVMRTGLIE